MKDKVCLYYHLGQCLGPCEYPVKKDVYKDMSDKVVRFMNGDTSSIIEELTKKMYESSEKFAFEQANYYKNMIASIQSVVNDEQLIEKDKKGDMDVFCWHEDKGYIAITGFLVRKGTVLNKEFKLRPLYGDAQEEFISFLLQYYQDHPITRLLLLPQSVSLENIDNLQEVLQTRVLQPQKGYRRKLLNLCEENAVRQLELKFKTVEKQDSQIQEAVEQLCNLAGCDMRRVELFDNSHISGQFTVASCVVYEDGLPDKKDYRVYKLHTGNSDVDSMKEVVYRRYYRLLMEQGRMPDGILVDGGWTQIEAAKEILDSLDLSSSIKIMGLVKDDKHTTRALMDTDGKELEVSKDSALFFLLTRMQDEVHRVAITYHRKLRQKAQTKSILDEIEGVGPKRKRLLLKSFRILQI